MCRLKTFLSNFPTAKVFFFKFLRDIFVTQRLNRVLSIWYRAIFKTCLSYFYCEKLRTFYLGQAANLKS